jgi:hypothetical protein
MRTHRITGRRLSAQQWFATLALLGFLAALLGFGAALDGFSHFARSDRVARRARRAAVGGVQSARLRVAGLAGVDRDCADLDQR